MNSPDRMDESTFADSTLEPPPVDDTTTLASETPDTPIFRKELDPFEIGNMQDDEETGPMSDPNQHSLPDPDELKVNQGNTAFHGCGKMLAWMFLILALFIAITVGLVVGLTKENRTAESALTNNGGSFTPVTRADVEAAMKTYIITNGVSSESDFASSTSPQSKALDFLANNDPLQLNAPLSGLSTDQGYMFITRYVMSLFYAALSGDTWNYNLLFNSKHDTCQWYDVFEPPVGQVGVLCDQNTKKIMGLSFISNQLDGTLPSELGVLTTLSYFESIGNNVKGRLPDRLQELTNLKTAVLAFNQISGVIPSWISKWQSLEFLYLSNNVFTGSVPGTIKQLQQLSVFAVDDNLLTGSMSFLWDMPQLEYVFVEDNNFVGRLPDAITTTSPLLIMLDVSSNQLDGPLPTDLFKLSLLEILDLHGNSFEGPIPSDIPTSNQKLSFVALHQNLLSSSIPTQLGLLENLRHLDLAANQLTGDIPSELMNLKLLTYLFLAENDFNEGPIPTFIYGLSSLRELSLKATRRSQQISELIQDLSNLILLDLDDNALTGPIPSEIGSLQSLVFLLLNRNQLSLAIPTELGTLNQLGYLLLDNNNLTGNLNTTCKNISFLRLIADCDEVVCQCCTQCCIDGVECHEDDFVPNVAPEWENGYNRQFFGFSNSSELFYLRPSG